MNQPPKVHTENIGTPKVWMNSFATSSLSHIDLYSFTVVIRLGLVNPNQSVNQHHMELAQAESTPGEPTEQVLPLPTPVRNNAPEAIGPEPVDSVGTATFVQPSSEEPPKVDQNQPGNKVADANSNQEPLPEHETPPVELKPTAARKASRVTFYLDAVTRNMVLQLWKHT